MPNLFQHFSKVSISAPISDLGQTGNVPMVISHELLTCVVKGGEVREAFEQALRYEARLEER